MEATIVTHTFNNKKGGKEILTWNLVQQFLNHGQKINIVAHDYKKIDHKNINFYSVKMIGKSFGLHRYIFARNAAHKVSEIGSDIILTHGKVGFGDVIRYGGVHRSYIEQMTKLKEGEFNRWLYKLSKEFSISNRLALYLEKKSLESQFKTLITPSEFLKKELLKCYPHLSSNSIEVIYNGYNSTLYNLEARSANRKITKKKLNVKPEKKIIIFVGNDYHRKGLKRIFPFLRSNKNWYLMVLGRGQKPTLEDDLERRIHWIGEVQNVAQYYAAADVLVLPTHYDGFGIVALEALAMGLYVVVSAKAGVSEIVKNDVLGKVSKNSIPDSLQQMKEDVVFSQKMIKKRADFALQYTWNEIANHYLNVFQRVIGS